MIEITNTGGVVKQVSKGEVIYGKPSNTDNVTCVEDTTKVIVQGAKENITFTLDNPNTFELEIKIKGLDDPIFVLPESRNSMSYYAESIEITAKDGVAFEVCIMDLVDMSSYDVMSTRLNRTSRMTVVQHGVEYLPVKVNVIDKASSFIGSLASRSVNFDLFEEDATDFSYDKPFEVYHEFLANSKSEYYYLDTTSLKRSIGTFGVDKGESTFDALSKTHKIVAFEDIEPYKVKQKMSIPQDLTGNELMSWICKQVSKPEPVYIGEMLFGDTVFDKINLNVDEITIYAYWVQAYAQLNMCNVYIINDTLTFVSLLTQEPTYTIREVDYTKPFNLSDLQVINTLVFESEEAVFDPIVFSNDESVETYGKTEFKIVDNRLINLYGHEEIRPFVDKMATKLFELNPMGYMYKAYECDTIYVNPAMSLADVIMVEDRDLNLWRSHITSLEWSYTPGVTGKMAGTIAPETLENYDITMDRINALNMGIKVNRIDAEITATIEKVDGYESQFTEIKQTIEDFKFTVQKGGGANLFKNSVGFGANITDFWTVSEDLDIDSGSNSWNMLHIAKHGFIFKPNVGTKGISQQVPVQAGQEYTISFNALKESKVGKLLVNIILDGQPSHILLVNDGEQYDGKFVYTFTPEVSTVGVGIYVIDTDADVNVDDIMLSLGNLDIWQQATGETYTVMVKIDENGVLVKNVDGKGYTTMTPEKFAIVYDNQELFTANKDWIEITKMIVRDGIQMRPIMFVQNGQGNSVDVVYIGGK